MSYPLLRPGAAGAEHVRRLLAPTTAAAVLLTALAACGGTTGGNGTPADVSSSATAPFQDLPDPVVPAGVSTDGVNPCSVLGDDANSYLDVDDARTEQTDAGPSCVYSAAGTTRWTLTFADQSLADFAQAEGGVNVAVVRASGRVVDSGSTCEIAVALTEESTLQVRWDDQEPGDGCRKTNVVASQAMQNLGAG